MCSSVGGGGAADSTGGGGGVDGSGGSSGVDNSGESIVYRSGGGGASIVYRSGGGRLYRNGWYCGAEWGFHGRGGERSRTGGGVCCKARSLVCEWEGIIFVSF